MRRALIHRVVLVFLALSGITHAQEEKDFTVERPGVAAPHGKVENVSISLAPLSAGPGRVFRRALTHPGAQALRVHFQIAASGAGPTWEVAILDHGGTRQWTYTAGPSGAPDFWSPEIEGNSVTIEVYTTAEAETVSLVIDRYLPLTEPPRQESITGRDQMAPIGNQAQRIRDWGRSVARIRFVGDDGIAYFCTGFLVAPDLLLTNEHCIQSEKERRSALVDFDYDTVGSSPKIHLLSKIEVLDSGLDYGLFRLAKAPGRPSLLLRDIQIADGQTLLIIQHPSGKPKQVSVVGCSVRYPTLKGRGSPGTDFGHLCDTLGGSSGSPVQDLRDGAVVGLHHLGFRKGTPGAVNQAVKIGKILQDIRSRNQGAYEEISAIQRER